MKKLLLIAAVLIGISALYSCHNDDDDYSKSLEIWYNKNNDWIKEMRDKNDADGKPYYQAYVPVWNPGSYILMRWINDPKENEKNLSPIYTSTIDVRYKLFDCDGICRDSSTNNVDYGPGIMRQPISALIPGWEVALTRMHVGDTCEFIVPYELAYGAYGNDSIAPYSNLRFNVRLVSIYRYEENPYD